MQVTEVGSPTASSISSGDVITTPSSSSSPSPPSPHAGSPSDRVLALEAELSGVKRRLQETSDELGDAKAKIARLTADPSVIVRMPAEDLKRLVGEIFTHQTHVLLQMQSRLRMEAKRAAVAAERRAAVASAAAAAAAEAAAAPKKAEVTQADHEAAEMLVSAAIEAQARKSKAEAAAAAAAAAVEAAATPEELACERSDLDGAVPLVPIVV